MSEMSEYWKDVSPVLQQMSYDKKSDNYKKSKKLIEQSGVTYQEYANGHFRVDSSVSNDVYDIWLTTGLFICRSTKERGRGVMNLLKLVK